MFSHISYIIISDPLVLVVQKVQNVRKRKKHRCICPTLYLNVFSDFLSMGNKSLCGKPMRCLLLTRLPRKWRWR